MCNHQKSKINLHKHKPMTLILLQEFLLYILIYSILCDICTCHFVCPIHQYHQKHKSFDYELKQYVQYVVSIHLYRQATIPNALLKIMYYQ